MNKEYLEGFVAFAKENGIELNETLVERAEKIISDSKESTKNITGEVWIGNKQLDAEIQLRVIGGGEVKAMSISLEDFGIQVLIDGNEVLSILEALE